jgi:hypothetical protein
MRFLIDLPQKLRIIVAIETTHKPVSIPAAE